MVGGIEPTAAPLPQITEIDNDSLRDSVLSDISMSSENSLGVNDQSKGESIQESVSSKNVNIRRPKPKVIFNETVLVKTFEVEKKGLAKGGLKSHTDDNRSPDSQKAHKLRLRIGFEMKIVEISGKEKASDLPITLNDFYIIKQGDQYIARIIEPNHMDEGTFQGDYVASNFQIGDPDLVKMLNDRFSGHATASDQKIMKHALSLLGFPDAREKVSEATRKVDLARKKSSLIFFVLGNTVELNCEKYQEAIYGLYDEFEKWHLSNEPFKKGDTIQQDDVLYKGLLVWNFLTKSPYKDWVNEVDLSDFNTSIAEEIEKYQHLFDDFEVLRDCEFKKHIGFKTNFDKLPLKFISPENAQTVLNIINGKDRFSNSDYSDIFIGKKELDNFNASTFRPLLLNKIKNNNYRLKLENSKSNEKSGELKPVDALELRAINLKKPKSEEEEIKHDDNPRAPGNKVHTLVGKSPKNELEILSLFNKSMQRCSPCFQFVSRSRLEGKLYKVPSMYEYFREVKSKLDSGDNLGAIKIGDYTITSIKAMSLEGFEDSCKGFFVTAKKGDEEIPLVPFIDVAFKGADKGMESPALDRAGSLFTFVGNERDKTLQRMNNMLPGYMMDCDPIIVSRGGGIRCTQFAALQLFSSYVWLAGVDDYPLDAVNLYLEYKNKPDRGTVNDAAIEQRNIKNRDISKYGMIKLKYAHVFTRIATQIPELISNKKAFDTLWSYFEKTIEEVNELMKERLAEES